ncbi:DUF1990 domain-containing protein [Gordonia malaquae]|uniref:DUF1990 family protein n=1 Tax=Gordonia malaquae TaxID=410332 RepID=UPI003018A840
MTAELTYRDVGASLRGEAPPGFHALHRETLIGRGADTFATARRSLLSWQVQRRSGVRVQTASDVVAEGVEAVVGIGVGPFRISGPVRVVAVIDEPTRAGFAYGTLPGHPETGEESFIVEVDDDGVVRFVLTGFSRPSTLLTKLGAPVASLVQRAITDRYARALL